MNRGQHKVQARGPRVVGTLLGLVLRVVVLLLGVAMIVASIALGWLPGPGGIPLFLAGVALLATQFEWARRLRAWTFARIRHATRLARQRSITPGDEHTDELAHQD